MGLEELPVIQVYVLAPLAVNVADTPLELQMKEGELTTVIVGPALTVIEIVSVSMQAPSVPVTV